MIFTQEMIDEIKYRLSLSGAKDTQFPKIDLQNNPIKGNETITLVKDGVNCRITMEALYEDIANYVGGGTGVSKEDFFNVSVYLGRLSPEEVEYVACTLQEAIEACPNYIQKNGQVIVFLDSQDNKWKAYQKTDTTKEWLDIEAFTVFHLANFVTINENKNPEDEDYVVDSPEIGVTQYAVQQVVNKLQNDLNKIISQTADADWLFSPKVVYVNASTTFSIKLYSTGVEMDAGRVTKVDGGETTEVCSFDTPTSEYLYNEVAILNTPKTVTYKPVVTIAGVEKPLASMSCQSVYPVYYGAGTDYTDITTYNSQAKTTAAGTYTITTQTSDYIFFLIPSNMHGGNMTAKMGMFPMLFDSTDITLDVTIDGRTSYNVSYKCYKSRDDYQAGTNVITISQT